MIKTELTELKYSVNWVVPVPVQFELGSSLSRIVLSFSFVFGFFLILQGILEPEKAVWKTFIYFKRNHYLKKKNNVEKKK